MSEESREVKPVMREYRCDKCHQGFMRPTAPPTQLIGGTVSIPHRCSSELCGHNAILNKRYPHIDFV